MSKSHSSLTPESPLDTRRRSVVIKQSNFIQKHGKLHHAFGHEKAPYPLSYDKGAIDLDILDHTCFSRLKGSVTFVDFKNGPPKKCLDLGCGTGLWVLDAAKEWPDCYFIGFDLVNIQPPAHMLPSQLASRINWVHGNFLTTKLPFEDDEFDHVHMRSLSRAVPENKWDYLFEEVSRVLRPGGAVEMIAEDIRFPALPRWYTALLPDRAENLPSIHLPDGISRSLSLSSPSGSPPNIHHDHALLESLYYSVFESRFINLKPTSLLPSYFLTYFRHVITSPVINFPMPPIPQHPTYDVAIRQRTSSSYSQSHQYRKSSSLDCSMSNVGVEQANSRRSNELRPYYSSPSDDTPIGSVAGMALLPVASLMKATGFTLSFHLYRAYNTVLACQESMWEELTDRLRNREAQLQKLGWNDDDLEGHHNRLRFDNLIERYKRDMQARVALWQSVTSLLSWKLPSGDPFSRTEYLDDSETGGSFRDTEISNEHETPCRSIRIFVGFKAIII